MRHLHFKGPSKTQRFFISLILVFLLISSMGLATTEAGSDIKVLINGQELSMDVAPVIIQGRTMVPMRAIFEALGAYVKWDGETEKITGTKGSTVVLLHLNNRLALINGETEYLDVPPTLVSGRTMVPARFIAESLGANVAWDNNTRIVSIFSKDLIKVSAPTGVWARTISSSEIQIGWNYVSGADYYYVYYGYSYNGPYYAFSDSSGYKTKQYFNGLTAIGIPSGTTSYYKVTAVKNGVESNFSSIVSATTFTEKPSEPLITQDTIKSRIDGAFEGWSGETIFKLINGQFWQQESYDYYYHYSYMPNVIIFKDGSRYKMQVEGVDKTIYVKRIEVLESRIDGAFEGWSGETIFKLTNGQIWQQSSYSYHYSYKYRPKVLIYQSGTRYKMQVEGINKTIYVKRIK